MSVRWRWDQGRLQYFVYENIRNAARALVAVENTALDEGADAIRSALEAETGLPFAAGPNGLWRNYARVFKSQLLAADVGGRLVCTELCHAIADERSGITADDYFLHLARHFYFSSPAFEDYSSTGFRAYPFCLVLKGLASNLRERGQEYIDIEEVLQRLVASDATGEESLSDIAQLRRRARTFTEAETRQVRELVIAISQLSFLKWSRSKLVVDGEVGDGFFDYIDLVAKPVVRSRLADPSNEILRLGKLQGTIVSPVAGIVVTGSDEERGFVEGNRVATYHVRIERSPSLRKNFFRRAEQPWLCDVCSLEPRSRYPWVENILELHHVLPLGSSIRLANGQTILDDLVSVCPNCHRSTHSYYTKWLRQNRRRDFVSREEAKEVYAAAKAAVRES